MLPCASIRAFERRASRRERGLAGGSGHGTKAVVVALFANLGIAVAKLVGFLITGASSMLAEAVHSAADSGNQGLLLLGGRWAKREATRRHPFGYGRERYFWAFVVALVLFSLGSLFSLYEGVSKLRDPHELASPLVAVVILLIAIALESQALRVAANEARLEKGDAGWWSYIRHARSPEIPVILLEDVGALFGLVFALTGVGLSTLTGDAVYDAYATLAIGVLLGVIAAVLAFEMRSLLLGESATPAHVATIEQAIGATPGMTELLHLQTQHLGPDELLVAGKVRMDGTLGFAEVVRCIDDAERRIREAVPIARVIYLEPDSG